MKSLRPPRSGFTLLELVISLAVVCALLVILLPALSTARMSSHRALCAGNQRLIGQAWSMYLDANDERFPTIHVLPAWKYGGVRFSKIDETTAFLDHNLPLNRYLPVHRLGGSAETLFCCPADRGITGETGGEGTGDRTAFEAFGTSYRANAALFAHTDDASPTGRGLHRHEITTAASRLVVMGDPVWYEVLESTGRTAAWHGRPDTGNLLFLDGSVRFVPVESRPKIGAAVFDPLEPGLAFPLEQR